MTERGYFLNSCRKSCLTAVVSLRYERKMNPEICDLVIKDEFVKTELNTELVIKIESRVTIHTAVIKP